MIDNTTVYGDGIKDHIKRDYDRKNPPFLVGIEIEGCLINDKGFPIDSSLLIETSNSSGLPLDYEYGKCQFEFKTDPVSFYDIPLINTIVEEFVERLDKLIEKSYPNENIIPVFLGANPSPHIFKEDIITDKPRYKKISRWQSNLHMAEMEGQYFKPHLIGSAIQGFHFHLQGKNADYTAHMFNHILNMIPSTILLGANSRLFGGRIYSIYEPRVFLSDQSEQHDSGFPAIPRYLDNLEDYVNYITSRKPLLAKNYYEMEKERHDDIRIRITPESYRVETRILSVQPTAQELMCMLEFFIGYLFHSISEQRQLRPISSIREERLAVIRYGYNAQGKFNLTENTILQLDFAKKGLSDLDVNPKFLDILYQRLQNRSSPGEAVVKLWDKKYNGSTEQTIVEIALDIWSNTLRNKPTT